MIAPIEKPGAAVSASHAATGRLNSQALEFRTVPSDGLLGDVSPSAEFAATLTGVVMGNDFDRNGNDTPDAQTAKLAWMNAWRNNV